MHIRLQEVGYTLAYALRTSLSKPLSGYPGMPFPPGMPIPAALVRPKRKQVKMAVSLLTYDSHEPC